MTRGVRFVVLTRTITQFALNAHERQREKNRVLALVGTKSEMVELGNAVLALVNRTGACPSHDDVWCVRARVCAVRVTVNLDSANFDM